MWSWRRQLAGHLIVAACSCFLLLSAAAATPADDGVPEEITPFTTQADMLAVTVRVHQEQPPEIVAVDPLAQGRLTVTQAGPYLLTTTNRAGDVLHELAFRAAFSPPGLEGHTFDSVELLFVVSGRDVARLTVSGPHGQSTWSFEG